jgi:tetratricopeptide (TPR) repeat protein
MVFSLLMGGLSNCAPKPLHSAPVPLTPAPVDSLHSDTTAPPAQSTPDTAQPPPANQPPLSSSAQLLLEACDNYLLVNGTSVKAAEVLTIKAATLYNNKRYGQSRSVYTQVLDSFATTPYAFEAVRMIAQTYYEEANYDQAQIWYRTLRDRAQEGGGKNEASARIAESIFRMAQSMEQQQRFSDAATHYERVALEFPDARIADVSLFNAGQCFEKVTDWSRAILMYQRLVQRYSASDHSANAAFRSAKCYEKLAQWDLAAETYLRVTAKYPRSEYAMAALYNAGFSFENGAKLREAAATFEKLVELYPQSTDAAEVLFKAGELYGTLKDWEAVGRVNKEFSRRFGNDRDRVVQALCMSGIALYMQNKHNEALLQLEQTLTTFATLQNPSTINSYYAARAQYTIAEISHEAMKNIVLRQPQSAYQQSLRTKSRLLEKAVEGYTRVIAFKISEWTTRSIFQLGQANEDFAMGVLAQERPRGESLHKQLALELGIAQALERYFIDHALKYHEQNVKLAIKQNIEDRFVLESRAKLTALPLSAATTYLTLVDIAKAATTDNQSSGFALIAQKLSHLQQIGPFQERAIALLQTCLEKAATYEEYSSHYQQASKLITSISFGVGETYGEVASIARKAPIPSGFDPYEAFVYKTKLLQQIQSYEDQSLTNFLKAVKIAQAYSLADGYVERSRERIGQLLFTRGRCYDILGITAFSTPPYPSGISQAEQEEYQARFEEIGMRFQEQAFETYRTILSYAQQKLSSGDYVTHAYIRLFQNFPQEFGVRQESIQPKSFSSGSQWLCTPDSVALWTTLDFSDNDWVKASKGALPDTSTPKGFPEEVPVPMWLAGSEGPVQQLFFRRTFYIKELPHKATLYAHALGSATFFLNGQVLGADSMRTGSAKAQSWDLLGVIREGKNVVAAQVSRQDSAAYGLLPFMHLLVTHNEYLPQPPGWAAPMALADASVPRYAFPVIENFRLPQLPPAAADAPAAPKESAP